MHTAASGMHCVPLACNAEYQYCSFIAYPEATSIKLQHIIRQRIVNKSKLFAFWFLYLLDTGKCRKWLNCGSCLPNLSCGICNVLPFPTPNLHCTFYQVGTISDVDHAIYLIGIAHARCRVKMRILMQMRRHAVLHIYIYIKVILYFIRW